MVTQDLRIHLRKSEYKTFCGRRIIINRIKNKPDKVTCRACLIKHDYDLKELGEVKYYRPDEGSTGELERRCLTCDEKFKPKNKFNFMCGCLSSLDLNCEY